MYIAGAIDVSSVKPIVLKIGLKACDHYLKIWNLLCTEDEIYKNAESQKCYSAFIF